jgi:hypothetical protein
MINLDAVKITPRDEEVLRLLAQGGSNKEIAGSLHISPVAENVEGQFEATPYPKFVESGAQVFLDDLFCGADELRDFTVRQAFPHCSLANPAVASLTRLQSAVMPARKDRLKELAANYCNCCPSWPGPRG